MPAKDAPQVIAPGRAGAPEAPSAPAADPAPKADEGTTSTPAP